MLKKNKTSHLLYGAEQQTQAVSGAPYKTPLHFALSRLPTQLASKLNVYGSLTALRPALQSRAVSRTEYPEGADLTLAGGGPTSQLAQGPRVGLWENGLLYFTYKRSPYNPPLPPRPGWAAMSFRTCLSLNSGTLKC